MKCFQFKIKFSKCKRFSSKKNTFKKKFLIFECHVHIGKLTNEWLLKFRCNEIKNLVWFVCAVAGCVTRVSLRVCGSGPCLCGARNCTWPLWKIMVSDCGFRGTSQCSLYQIVHEAKLHLKLGVLHALSSIHEDSPCTPVEKVVLCNVGLTDFFPVKRCTNKCKVTSPLLPAKQKTSTFGPAVRKFVFHLRQLENLWNQHLEETLHKHPEKYPEALQGATNVVVGRCFIVDVVWPRRPMKSAFSATGSPWRGVASAFPWEHQLRKGHLMCPPERAASRHRDQVSWQTTGGGGEERASSRFGVSRCRTFFEHAELVVECWVGSMVWFWWRSAGSGLDWSSSYYVGTWPLSWPVCGFRQSFCGPGWSIRGPPCRVVKNSRDWAGLRIGCERGFRGSGKGTLGRWCGRRCASQRPGADHLVVCTIPLEALGLGVCDGCVFVCGASYLGQCSTWANVFFHLSQVLPGPSTTSAKSTTHVLQFDRGQFGFLAV